MLVILALTAYHFKRAKRDMTENEANVAYKFPSLDNGASKRNLQCVVELGRLKEDRGS